MLPKTTRSYHDPLHGAITLDSSDPDEAILIRLIDTPTFQRLRRIRQLGPANLTFHGAESSRFTHSLGVVAVTRRAFDRLQQLYPELHPHRPAILCAALLHDIGHGPFSHTAEDIFGLQHEDWTRRLIHEDPDIHPLLELLSPLLPDILDQIYTHQYPVPLVWQLISSQLDCDRLDYLLRDSYFTGTSYGRLDLERILMALEYEPISKRLVVAHKGLSAVEHYLVVRHFMYGQVYNHPKNIAITWLMEQAFNRARELLKQGQLEADPTATAWLTQPPDQLSLATYLAGDDILFTYHLQRWCHQQDVLLADLCRRYLNRDLLKTLEVSHLSPEQRQNFLTQVQAHLDTVGFNSQHYCGLRHSWSRGYTPYQQGIELHAENRFYDINTLSPLVQALSQPTERIWLLYPRQIKDWIDSIWPDYNSRGLA